MYIRCTYIKEPSQWDGSFMYIQRLFNNKNKIYLDSSHDHMFFSENAHVINNVMTTCVLTPAQLPNGYHN